MCLVCLALHEGSLTVTVIIYPSVCLSTEGRQHCGRDEHTYLVAVQRIKGNAPGRA